MDFSCEDFVIPERQKHQIFTFKSIAEKNMLDIYIEVT